MPILSLRSKSRLCVSCDMASATWATFSRHTGQEIRGALCDPIKELGKSGVGAQGLGRGIVPGQFRLAQNRMNLFVTNVMHENCRPAFSPFQLWDQVVERLRDMRRDRAQAQGADRIGGVLVLLLHARGLGSRRGRGNHEP